MHKLLSFTILGLFFAFYGSMTMFMHIHVVNGVTIVHSHFYLSDNTPADNQTSHQHSSSELILIDLLMHWVTDEPSGPCYETTRRSELPVYDMTLATTIPGPVAISANTTRGPPPETSHS